MVVSMQPDPIGGILLNRSYQQNSNSSYYKSQQQYQQQPPLQHSYINTTNSGSFNNAATMTDPAGDIRGNLARLTARARQLLVDDTDTRVVRNGLSAYETSRKMVNDMSGRSRFTGQSGSTQASVELFMASLGFNLQEQQRLLQQLQSTHVPLAVASGVGAAAKLNDDFFPSITTGKSDELGSALEEFVANRRQDIMRRSVEEMHLRVGQELQERSEAIIRASWEKCSIEVADAFESFSLKPSNNNNNVSVGVTGGELSRIKSSTGALSNGGPLHMRAGVATMLSGRDANSTKILNKIAAFAQIVDTQPSSQWVSHFASHVADEAASVTDTISLLWNTVEQMLQPIIQHGSASNTMTFVASSRHMMERKALIHILSKTLKIGPERFGELENMHAARFVDIVERYTSSSNPWAHIYTAMRCGRYDAAAIVANKTGIRVLEIQLTAYANAQMTQRSGLPSAVELRSLYEEDSTRTDPYRQIVLILLLLGNIGESSDVVLSIIASLSAKVARSLEDTLWIRLFCVRSVEVRGGDKLQALAEMQRLLLDDMQELVTLVRGDVVRLASLLFHALLPSSALRLLIENDNTYIDGIHLAMCFHTSQLLPCGEVEVPIDLSRLLPQYCSLVLLDANKRHIRIVRAGASIFRYFQRTNLINTFVDYCGNELVCAKLFGQRGGRRDGVLIPLQTGGAPSKELLDAMEKIAEAAVARGQTELAVHIFIVLEEASTTAAASAAREIQDSGMITNNNNNYVMISQVNNNETDSVIVSSTGVTGTGTGGGDANITRASYALSRAVQVICPALAQAFHQSPSTYNSNLFMHAADLQERLARTRHSIPHIHAETFQLLCELRDVFVAIARGEAAVALRCFYKISFIPTNTDEVTRAVGSFDTTPECVAMAAPPIIILAMQQMLKLAEEYKLKGEIGEAGQLRRRAQALVLWARRLQRHVNRRLVDELTELERLFAL